MEGHLLQVAPFQCNASSLGTVATARDIWKKLRSWLLRLKTSAAPTPQSVGDGRLIRLSCCIKVCDKPFLAATTELWRSPIALEDPLGLRVCGRIPSSLVLLCIGVCGPCMGLIQTLEPQSPMFFAWGFIINLATSFQGTFLHCWFLLQKGSKLLSRLGSHSWFRSAGVVLEFLSCSQVLYLSSKKIRNLSQKRWLLT